MEKGEKYLPIGTVAMLEKKKKRVMITGFAALNGEDKTKIYDYSGCIYPEGFISPNKTCLFDHSQIKEIYHMGLAEDEEEKSFKRRLAAAVVLAEESLKNNNNK